MRASCKQMRYSICSMLGYNSLPHQRMIVHDQNPYPFRLHCLSPQLIAALKHMRRLLGKPTLIKVGRDDKPP